MSNENVCGCGECDFCQNLTKELQKRLTPQEREFDNHMTRLKGSDSEGDDE